MTEEEIAELERQVAEHVMGWKLVGKGMLGFGVPPAPVVGGSLAVVPRYARDIGATMEVIAFIQSFGWSYWLTGATGGVVCELWLPSQLALRCHGRGETESEAICRAALKWAERHEEEVSP